MWAESSAPDVADVLDSAALAATLPPPGAANEVVIWATGAGVRGAARGSIIPLPVLLDVRSLWVGRGPFWLLMRPAPAPTEESRAYEEWLVRFCDQCRVWFGGRTSSAAGWDVLPALSSAWRCGGNAAGGFRRLYAALSEPEAVERIVRVWCGPRDAATSRLRRWLSAVTEDDEPTLAGGLWSSHSTAGETVWLDATFDHEAARMYLSAADPAVSSEQYRRIIKLRLRRKSLEFSRAPTSFEEPNPYAGSLMLATLILEELGDHKIVNGTDIRISSNPPALPPQDVDVHLHWAHASEGLKRKHEAPDFGGGPARQGVRPADASLLQGFAALLFDDWRSVLRDLPIRFHAHCGSPNLKADGFGRGGKRWRPGASGTGPMPPQSAVVRFFRRCDWVALAQNGLRWEQPRGLGGWGCLLTLRCDLPEFGFSQGEYQEFPDRNVWRAEADAVPGGISVVIVLDSPGGDATLCRVLRSHSSVFLTPVRTRAIAESKPDPAFLDVRSAALDLLLDALEHLMR